MVILYRENTLTVRAVKSWEGCRGSLLEDIENPTGFGPDEALRARAGAYDSVGLQRSLSAPTLLWWRWKQ